MDLFVSGRLCLFGEHSDWAGVYRLVNPVLYQGYTIICGTNQGIYARVQSHPSRLILRTCFNDGGSLAPLELSMDAHQLLEVAHKGGFFSYAAGVAYQFLTHFRVQGLEIDNYRTDLPMQKGLSSSAAICVLVSRAFNVLYDLKLSVRGEMEFAYHGEITTPSRCGRMDQACAYGNQPILMVFDGDRTEIIPLTIPKDLYWLIVDLGGNKNTQEILHNLHQCFPFAHNHRQEKVQEYLGKINTDIVQQAVKALQQGDAVKLGQLMQIAQIQFDRHLIPACPNQLTSPILHQLLNYEPLQPYVLGGKGVGSQGDGTAQFIVKDEATREKAIAIINRDFPQMECLKLTIYGNK